MPKGTPLHVALILGAPILATLAQPPPYRWAASDGLYGLKLSAPSSRPHDWVAPLPTARPNRSGAVGSGNEWWPLVPGTCIDYAVYAVNTSWNPSTNQLDVMGRYAQANSVRICAQTASCAGCGYGTLLMEQYEQPANVARGFLYEGGHSTQGVKYTGEAGNAGYIYTNSFLAKIPHQPAPGMRLAGMTGLAPPTSCTASCTPPAPTDAWSMSVISMGAWGSWADTARTGLEETVQGAQVGRYNYIFQRGTGMVNFWYANTDTDPALVRGFEYYATSFPTDESSAIGQGPMWLSYP